MKILLKPKGISSCIPIKLNLKMRITLLCLLFPLFGIQAKTTYAQKTISLKVHKATVLSVLDDIENHTDYNFVYKVNDIDLSRLVDLTVDEKEVPKVLEELFKGTDVNFKVFKDQVFLKKENVTTTAVNAQDGVRIKGSIVDDDNGVPILGANIIEKDNPSNGSYTDIDGEFSLDVPSDATIVISYVGYTSQEIEVDNLSLKEIANLQIRLQPEASGLDEVVVVGYGKQSRLTMVGSVSTIEPDKLRSASTNITSNLAGNLSGVIGVQRSGQPGADGASFYIRGLSTYSGASEPLILLDGVEISAYELDQLVPEIIESVSVLKDATATAVYGNQGANGVLIITTKEGIVTDKPKIHVRAQTTVSTPTKTPSFVNAADYMRIFNEAVNNRNTGDRLYSNDKIDGAEEHRNPYVYPDVDWYRELFKSAAIEQEANIDIQGGGEKVGYYMSANFNHKDGLLRNFSINDYKNKIDVKQFNFQNNINAELSPSTRIALKLNTQLEYNDGPATGVNTIYSQVMNTNPADFPMYFPSDSITRGRDLNYGTKDGGAVNSGYINPFAEATNGYSNEFTSKVLATLTGEQDLDFITRGLKFKALVSFKNMSTSLTTRSRGYNFYKVDDYELLSDGTYDYTIRRVGDFQELNLGTSSSSSGHHQLHIQPSITYNRKFEKHNVGGLFLYNLKEYSNNNPGDLIASLPERRIGFVGRVTYDFDNRYLFEGNFAYNGTENFAKHSRFGFFPSLSAGYVVSSEKWFNSSVIDLLKFRVSWGRVGNDNIGGGRFPYISDLDLHGRSYTTGIDQNISYSGPVYNQFENRAITWETADKYNFGVQLDMFEGLHFNADYFYEKRKDIFDDISSTIPGVFGTEGTSVFANVGEVTNRGIDFAVDFNKRVSDDFYINTKGTFTYAHNTINKNNEPSFSEFPNLSAVGTSIGTHLGYVAERLFIDDAEVSASPDQNIGGEAASSGDVKYRDITGDGTINSDDRKYIGNPEIPEIIFGLSTSMRYKHWDLSFLLQGAAKTSLMMSGFHPFGKDGIRNALDWVADNRYNPDNPDIYATYPKLSKRDNANNTVGSTYWLREGSFLKLRTLELGFNYKKTRFFVSGYNLLTFSKFNKWDPEEGGGSGLKYPTQRKFNIGVEIRFN